MIICRDKSLQCDLNYNRNRQGLKTSYKMHMLRSTFNSKILRQRLTPTEVQAAGTPNIKE
jgi:hypothetical protein